MSIKIKVDLKGVTDKLSDRSFIKGRVAMANQILLDTTNYVPLDPNGGELRASGHVAEGGVSVDWTTVYARAQFYGTNGIVAFNNYTTPGTGKRWDLKAKANHMSDWKNEFVKGAGL